MNTDINYSGYSAQPSDYECPDGSLAASINLIAEDHQLKPLPSPKKKFVVSSGHEVLIFHQVPNKENIIILNGNREGECSLSCIENTPDLSDTSLAAAIPSATLSGFLDIAIVGNMIIVTDSQRTSYILWTNGSYKFLGDKPPFIEISFGAYKAGTAGYSSDRTYDTSYSSYLVTTGGNGSGSVGGDRPPLSDGVLMELTDQALGSLYSAIKGFTERGYVYQPLFVRYAFRLFDGSYSWHSSPVLILPTVVPPYIGYSGTNASGGIKVTTTASVPYFGISYKIFGDIDAFKEWADVITGIDVFFSTPIYTYDQSKNVLGHCAYSKFYSRYYDSVLWSSISDRGRDGNYVPAVQNYFVGHYADNINGDGIPISGINGDYIDHFVSVSDSKLSNNVVYFKETNFVERLINEHLFYKVASFTTEELVASTQMKRLPLENAALENIETLERLEDDFYSHASMPAKGLHVYNQRLFKWDFTFAPPRPMPLHTMAQVASRPGQLGLISNNATLSIKVFSRYNGTKLVSEYVQGLPSASGPTFYPISASFPRFLFHPDPEAYRMEIVSPAGECFVIPLKRHPFLNGAYWFGGITHEATGFFPSDDTENGASAFARISNRIYVSRTNNPLSFPAESVVHIGCSHISKLASAAKALSQGQFGQYPLYAFTDEGIWALETSATGAVSARQPITRDVCSNPKAITQIDSAVLFPSDRGIMLLSGSQAECISEAINSQAPFDIKSLPAIDSLHPDTCFPLSPLREFLATCGMIYDYPHQHLIVFNPGKTYAYVYSFRSQQWGMMHSSIQASVNSYPEALAIASGTDGEGNATSVLVDFSDSDLSTSSGLFVTRPLKLGLPDALKTVDTVIQRGHFQRGHVQCVLYGSRDLVNWHLVWSSQDHYLRGFRGTPYKYFRIACLTTLAEGESIFGSSIAFDPRFTRKLR